MSQWFWCKKLYSGSPNGDKILDEPNNFQLYSWLFHEISEFWIHTNSTSGSFSKTLHTYKIFDEFNFKNWKFGKKAVKKSKSATNYTARKTWNSLKIAVIRLRRKKCYTINLVSDGSFDTSIILISQKAYHTVAILGILNPTNIQVSNSTVAFWNSIQNCVL